MARQLSIEDKVSLWAVGLLAVSLSMHVRDLSETGKFERSIKTSDFMRLYVTGAIAHDNRWDGLYDPAVHLEVARSRVDRRLGMSGFHPNYGPTAAAFLAPVSQLPFAWAWAALSVFTIAVYLAGVWRASQAIGAPIQRQTAILLIALANPALADTIRYGQLSGVTTALFFAAAALYCRGSVLLGGVCLGLAFYKPNLVLPAMVIALLARQGRLLSGLCLGAFVHLMIGIAIAGLDPTVAWFEVLASLARDPRQVQDFGADAHSLHGFWRLLGNVPPALTWLSGLSSLIAMGAAVIFWRRPTSPADRWAVLTLATILVSPHLMTYDLLLLAVPLVLTAGVRLPWTTVGRWQIGLAAALYFSPFLSPRIAQVSGFQYSTVVVAAFLGFLMLSDDRRIRPAGVSVEA